MAGLIMTGRKYSLDQLAAEVDLPATTIRRWVHHQIIPASYGKAPNRYFTNEHRDRILRIKAEREKQRTLPDIAEYIDNGA